MATIAVAFLVGMGIGWLIAVIREPEMVDLYGEVADLEAKLAHLEQQLRDYENG